VIEKRVPARRENFTSVHHLAEKMYRKVENLRGGTERKTKKNH
jgi:hypothetical protein